MTKAVRIRIGRHERSIGVPRTVWSMRAVRYQVPGSSAPYPSAKALMPRRGKPIPKARLDAIPWTRFTVEAQAQLEKEGALRQRRLGALGSVDSAGAVEVEEEEEAEEKPAKEKE